MSIVAIEEIPQDEGQIELQRISRNYKRRFYVVTSSYLVGRLEVMLAYLSPTFRIPRVGEYYAYALEYDTGAIVTRVRAKRQDDDDPTLWYVEVDYASITTDPAQQQTSGGGGGGNPGGSSPVFQGPEIIWGTKIIQVAILETTDATPRPIVNSAGAPYDPPATREVALRTLRIIRNEVSFRPFSMQLYVKTTNEDVFQEQDPGTVLCEDIQAARLYADGTQYDRVTYDFLFADNHTLNLIDQGPFYLSEGPTGDPTRKKINFVSTTGGGIGSQLLDGAGNPLPSGERPITRNFRIRYTNKFGDLELPDPAWL